MIPIYIIFLVPSLFQIFYGFPYGRGSNTNASYGSEKKCDAASACSI